jgi:uncharacterized protein
MNETIAFLLALVVIFLTHFQSCITGFGATVLAMPFVALLIGLEEARFVLMVQGWLLALLVVIESWRKIAWREFAIIISLMGIAIPIGQWMFVNLPANTLMIILSVFTVAVGIEGLIKHFRPGAAESAVERSSARSRWLASLFLPLAGAIHGAFATGGPLLVIYATRAIPDKSLFRVTLCLTWTVLNSWLIGSTFYAGGIAPRILMMTGLCIPVSVFGFWLGNRVHYRVNQHLFRQIVFVVLTAVGLFMGWSAINQYRKAAREERKAAASRLETDTAGSIANPFAREAFAAFGVTHRPVPGADGEGCGS